MEGATPAARLKADLIEKGLRRAAIWQLAGPPRLKADLIEKGLRRPEEVLHVI